MGGNCRTVLELAAAVVVAGLAEAVAVGATKEGIGGGPSRRTNEFVGIPCESAESEELFTGAGVDTEAAEALAPVLAVGPQIEADSGCIVFDGTAALGAAPDAATTVAGFAGTGGGLVVTVAVVLAGDCLDTDGAEDVAELDAEEFSAGTLVRAPAVGDNGPVVPDARRNGLGCNPTGLSGGGGGLSGTEAPDGAVTVITFGTVADEELVL